MYSEGSKRDHRLLIFSWESCYRDPREHRDHMDHREHRDHKD